MSTAKTFEIAVEEGVTADSILERARSAARSAGIVISGDDNTGRFEGTAQGSYTVDAASRLIRVEVTDKPGFVPWSMIETALRKAFR